MKIKIGISIVLAGILSGLYGQIAPSTFWVPFTDKAGTLYSIESPEAYLSERSLARRNKQGIAINESDLPVSPVYIDSLKSLGLEIVNISKWFNGAVVYSNDLQLLDTLHKISFIAGSVVKAATEKAQPMRIQKYPIELKSASDYGYTAKQIEMVQGNALHELGYTGEGMLVAVLDAGFDNTKTIESLEHLWQNNQIIAWRDFVNDGEDMFEAHSHGTLVLSILAGKIPETFYGSAPGANYVLVRTEKGSTEFLVEEYNWVCGAEYADSMGVDVINSSLGYALFDDPSQNHSYSDMNGHTTPISRAAIMAARKGMLVHNSAGNSGDEAWGYITAPADADSILTIGACDSLEIIASFSSRGNTYDNRVKPDITAMGLGTISQIIPGTLRTCNGTSCSSPLAAGFSACLWQANPTATAQQVRNAVIMCSNRYASPDTIYGYGIPDYAFANSYLNNLLGDASSLTQIKISPNPAYNQSVYSINLPWLTSSKEGIVEVYQLSGLLIMSESQSFNPGFNTFIMPQFSKEIKGYFVMRVTIDGRTYQTPYIIL